VLLAVLAAPLVLLPESPLPVVPVPAVVPSAEPDALPVLPSAPVWLDDEEVPRGASPDKPESPEPAVPDAPPAPLGPLVARTDALVDPEAAIPVAEAEPEAPLPVEPDD
jgi:hypothetical protein